MWIFEREFTQHEVEVLLSREVLQQESIYGIVTCRVRSHWSWATREDGTKLPLIRITVLERPAEGEE